MFISPTPERNGVLKGDPKRSLSVKRVYQTWKGSNIFLLGGRLIFGPDARSVVVTIFLIVAPVVAFCIYVARPLMHEFAHHAGIAIMVVAAWFTFDILVLLLLTSARDPGIIPRSTHPPEPEEDYDSIDSPSTLSEQTPRPRLPRTKDVIVNGVSVKIKYCDTCMLYRPPRCSHCSICNNCVERFDHHCPWVGQCIGRRNYPFFFLFISSATLLCVYVFAMSALHIKKSMEAHSYTVWRALGKSPASIVLMVYTFIAIWFVGGLTVFHLYLISTNQTTYENFRYRYDNKVNPYDCGIAHNFREIFWTRIPPSKNNFRAKVQQDFSSTANVQSAEFGNVPVSKSRKACDTKVDIFGWTMIDENSQEFDSRKSHFSGMEMKTGYTGHALPLGGCNSMGSTHHRLSGSECGGLEIAPATFALDVENSTEFDARKSNSSGMEMKTGNEYHALPLEGSTGGTHHRLSGLECESGSLEISPDAFALDAEHSTEFDARKHHFSGMEMKSGYGGHPLPLEGCDATGVAHKLSELECESGSLEFAPDTFALAAGVCQDGNCTLETDPHQQTGYL